MTNPRTQSPGAKPLSIEELRASLDRVVEERDELKKAMVEAVIPLEVIAGQDRVRKYRELSRSLIAQVNVSIDAVRAALQSGVGGRHEERHGD